MYDVIIIGAGISGLSTACHLSRYSCDMLILDRGADVSEGATKANSGIVHAGYDATPGTEKARFNVKGARMYEDFCKSYGVPYQKTGALVLGFTDEDENTLKKLLERSVQNEVPGCRLLTKDEALQMEPNLNPDIALALYVPESAITSPYELTYALADHAKINGAKFLLNTNVESLSHEENHWLVHTDNGVYKAKAVINCAGTGADVLHNIISTKQVKIIPRRGEYYLLDRLEKPLFSMTIFQVPTSMGKGVLVTPTTHGNLLIGPNAEDIPLEDDTATTRDGLDEVFTKAKRTWQDISLRTVITTFSGIRAHEKEGDFIIGKVEGAPAGAFEAIGIESPGLSAGPAIGIELGDMVAEYLKLSKNTNYMPPTPQPKPFNGMSDDEKKLAYEKDPDYGKIVCRCEQVTEAEIRHSIRRPVGATSVDGVKRRTRAGMGRCQGGFCSLRVAEILKEELGEDNLLTITKMGKGSEMLTGKLSEGEI
ncbi:MAG: NAD(P)/FAD-dependent oxidoreductase [Christensenellaceae bacterium]|nr:NAD(P)/FAD-dependent oxidoreductase [Christensenellaceae bacterium]